MLRRKTSAFLASIAVFASAGAAVVATATAQAAPAAACNGNSHSSQLNFVPGFSGVAPYDVKLDLSNETIDPANGCTAVLDWGDGSAQVKPADNVTQQPHHYKDPGNYEVTLFLTWPGVQYTETADVFVGGRAGQAVVGRLQGADRKATAVRISQNQWTPPGSSPLGQADAVVLARADQFPDALAGAPLAAYKRAPLLLTDPTGLYQGADTEINRILPKGKTVYILGGPVAVSTGIDAQLVAEGYKVQRLYGDNRFATALQIAKVGLNDPPKVVVATGRDFADALAAGPLAAGPLSTRKAPADPSGQPAAIILTDGKGFFDQASIDYVHSKLQPNTPNSDCTRVTVVGGAAKAAVTPMAVGSCWDDKLVGTDRYDTSHLVFQRFSNIYVIGVATGTGFPDALAGGAYLANLNQPLLLTDPKSVTTAVGEIANGTHAQDGVADFDIFGGPAAVSDHVVYQLQQAVQTGSFPVP
jgi:putative cell wall-binding protein